MPGVSNHPLLVQGALPADTAWVLIPLDFRGALLLNGRPSVPDAVAVYGAGAAHEGASHGDSSWGLLALRGMVVERLLELPRGSPIARPGGYGMLICDPASWRRAASLLRAFADVATTDPAVFEIEAARRSLRASVLEIAQDLLAGPWDGERPRLLRRSPARQRIVRAAEESLRAAPGRAITTVDLAAALGVSQARLRLAFRSTFGIGPQHYLRLRRLTLLRRALRSARRDGPSPQDVALAHGFWQLGRLVRDYRDLFSEHIGDVVGIDEGPYEYSTHLQVRSGR